MICTALDALHSRFVMCASSGLRINIMPLMRYTVARLLKGNVNCVVHRRYTLCSDQFMLRDFRLDFGRNPRQEAHTLSKKPVTM